MLPHRISILGVGLLGGSIGLAAKSAINKCHVTGYGHRRQSLQAALEMTAIDTIADNLPDAVRGQQLVVLCTPVGIFQSMLQQLAELLEPGAIVTDVGSTKRSVVELAQKLLPKSVHFVGSHPMAGSEKRGVEFARTDLFAGAQCLLTPAAQTDLAALGVVEEFWQAIGMRTTRLDPDEHDRLLADISHLPHALSAALVSMQDPAALALAGKGFLDTTRIASGDGPLWRDILLDNRDNVLSGITRLKKQLAQVEKLLKGGASQPLADWLNQAAARRQELLNRKLREVSGE